MNRPMCVHCGRGRGTRPRDLCSKCFNDLTVRECYKTRDGRRPSNKNNEPTAEEIEVMIAEQLPTMPGGRPEGWEAERERLRWKMPVFKCNRRRGRSGNKIKE